MILQRIVWPNSEICSEEKLYFHTNTIDETYNGFYDENRLKPNINVINYDRIHFSPSIGLVIDRYGKVSFDTYFNSFSYDKWKRYTCINKVTLSLVLSGRFTILLCQKEWNDGNVNRTVLSSNEIVSKEPRKYDFDFKFAEKGMLYFEIVSDSENSVIYSGCYKDDTLQEFTKNIKLGLNICTYKRESYIEKNIHLLNEFIIDNKDSVLHNNLEVFISDNGHTLDIERLSNNCIHIVQNKNAGGAGGFTRGLIEILKNDNAYNISHVLMMDDDVRVSPESLERTYTLLSVLKDEYKDSFIGGAMLRLDKPNYQVEAGASWNAGELHSNKSNLNLNVDWDCLVNEKEEFT